MVVATGGWIFRREGGDVIRLKLPQRLLLLFRIFGGKNGTFSPEPTGISPLRMRGIDDESLLFGRFLGHFSLNIVYSTDHGS